MQKNKTHMIYLLFVLSALVGCNQFQSVPELPETSETDTLIDLSKFMPSSVLGDTILKHEYLIISYSIKYKNPEWTIYCLNKDKNNSRESVRRTNFHPDPSLPDGTAKTWDYGSSGYDRGHLVPAEDMNFNESAMNQSFYMSNISPQLPDFNRGIWKKLENSVRKLANENGQIIVITGPVFSSADSTIGDSIRVPNHFYKVIYKEAMKGKKPKALTFLIPNEKSDKPLKDYISTIRIVETLTGLNFFPNMDTTFSEELENSKELSYWNFN